MRQRLINLAGIIGFLILLLGAGCFLYLAFLQTGEKDVSVSGVLAPKDEAESTEEEAAVYANIPEDMELLKKYQDYNSDVVGIIRIPDTVLNHPVTQTPDEEEYYLYKDLNREYNSHGVPFLSAESKMEGKEGNRVIYGHNIHKKTRDVFCDLAGYEELSYYQEHPVIETVSESGTRRWLIFAYFLADNADAEPFRYSDTLSFPSKQAFDAYMGEVEKRNWLQVSVELGILDTYLTLSSCSNELSGSGTNRMVVMAKEIPYSMDVSGIVGEAVMRESPKLPERLTK